jgi:P-type E1-E2 ATPase
LALPRVLGNRRLLEAQKIETPAEVSATVSRLEREGKSVLFVGVNDKISGLIAVADVTREQAYDTVETLRQLGIEKLIMLTGDNHQIASEIAEEIGLQEFYAELLPEQKVDHVKALEEAGYKTAMVGDGINDAPALATASVGIAMGVAGTDVAIETADIALMTDDLTKVAEVVSLSRQTLRVIQQNIWLFGVFVNLGGIILATMGSITPIGAALLHNVGSVAVVLNSARLAFQKSPTLAP